MVQFEAIHALHLLAQDPALAPELRARYRQARHEEWSFVSENFIDRLHGGILKEPLSPAPPAGASRVAGLQAVRALPRSSRTLGRTSPTRSRRLSPWQTRDGERARAAGAKPKPVLVIRADIRAARTTLKPAPQRAQIAR
jgi:hypothetical protein